MLSEKQKLDTLMVLGIELNRIHDLDILLERVLTRARQFVNADAGSIYVREGKRLRFAHSQNDTLQKKMPPGEKPLSAADCYHFVLSHPDVDVCLAGPRTEQEMNEGLKALDLGPLSDEEMVRIRKIGDYVHG